MGLPHGQAGKQPDKHSHVYNVLHKRDLFFCFFFSSFLCKLNKQTRLSRSLYSCDDFCVSVCFNLNRFQVPSLPKSASSFSPLIQLLTLKLSLSPPSLSPPLFLTFPSTLKRRHSVPSFTLYSSLLLLPLLSPFFFPFLSPPLMRKRRSEFYKFVWRANMQPALTSRVQKVTVTVSPYSLMGADPPRSTASWGLSLTSHLFVLYRLNTDAMAQSHPSHLPHRRLKPLSHFTRSRRCRERSAVTLFLLKRFNSNKQDMQRGLICQSLQNISRNLAHKSRGDSFIVIFFYTILW